MRVPRSGKGVGCEAELRHKLISGAIGRRQSRISTRRNTTARHWQQRLNLSLLSRIGTPESFLILSKILLELQEA